MIGAVVVVPSPPMLLPEYVGRADRAAALRERCVSAVREGLGCGDDLGRVDGSRRGDAPPAALRPVLVVATDRDPRSTRASLGLRVGRLLLGLAGVDEAVGETTVVEVAWDAPVEQCRALGRALAESNGELVLVVVGDGTARRGEKAPGHLDPRSGGVDAEIVAGLSGPDPSLLLGLDPALCADLLVGGRAPLQVAAAAIGDGTAYRTALCHAEDPYGVQYVVAIWRHRTAHRTRRT